MLRVLYFKKIEKLEISVGGFGRQLPENFEDTDDDDDDDDGMVDEDEMLYGLMREYGDDEPYVVVIEHSYGVILSEKKNIEKAPEHGIEKFRDSLMLKEWYKKIIIVQRNGGNEEGFSPVRGLVVYKEKNDDGGGFSTPNVEKVDNTDNLSCSQFLEHLEVLATEIKMTNDAVLESYKKRGKKMLETLKVCEEDDDNGKKGKKREKFTCIWKITIC
ncbi:unnamed protein product [Lactuca saligna]|uniref:Uncharacterized protein n=1 Tax=Lactuca saligna TaxID=75948 RepID=A0AA35YAD0_LACSI|nr:unnamed protein product [Lactuca saligna]